MLRLKNLTGWQTISNSFQILHQIEISKTCNLLKDIHERFKIYDEQN